MDRGWLLCDTAGVVGWFCSPSTGSPFGHHPRLRMVCPLWGQWMSMWRRFACLRPCISCIVCRHSHHLSSSAASTQRYSRLWRRRTASIEHPHKSTLASGGGVPCLTAGDARRVNSWKEDRENSDAGGVALQALREKVRWAGVVAVRHRQCRRVGLSTFHGFALWASPAVTHGVSPLGTVDEHVEAFRLPPPLHIAYSFVDALIHYFACLCSCISCIVCRPSHHLSSSAASTQRYSRLWRCRTASIEQPHKSTLASGGGAPCLTAGDARRVNPWKEDRENSDAGGVALQALREKLRWVEVVAVRHRRCRRVGLSTFHGFALWASPAVTHGVSPLGTVDEHVEAFRLPPPLHIAYSL